MRQPSLRRIPRPRMTRMRQPRMPRSFNPMGMQPMGGMSAVPPLPQAPPVEDPSQIMMSEDVISRSDLMKMNYSDMAELRILLRRIARAKQQEAKESKKKAGTTSATEGAMPSHPPGIRGMMKTLTDQQKILRQKQTASVLTLRVISFHDGGIWDDD